MNNSIVNVQEYFKTAVALFALSSLAACGGGGGGPPPAPIMNVSPTALTYVDQVVGSNSAAQTLTITNTGNAVLSILGESFTGTNAASFLQTNNCGPTLTPGSNCTVSVIFNPTTKGANSATLGFSSNATVSPTVALSGNGLAPIITVATTPIAFSNQLVGTSSAASTVSISNTGTAPLHISGVIIAGSNASAFTTSNNCPTAIAINASCTLSVTFNPNAMGALSGTLTINSDGGAAQAINLTGTGIAPVLAISPTSLSFATQTAGTTSGPQVITVTNSGTAPLTVKSVSISGNNAAMFSESDTCNSAIAPNGTCAVSIKFSPTAAGNESATVTVGSDGGTQATQISAISVLPPVPTVSNLSLNLNVLGVGSSTTSGQVTATDPTGLTLVYTIGSKPTEGTATLDASKGSVSYTLSGYPSKPTVTSDSMMINVSNGYTSSNVTVSIALNGDPLLPNQWHIQNTGQSAFSTILPVAGNDMNVTGAWQQGITGKGIKVGVVDTGLEINHEDLKANVDASHSFNFLTNTNDPTPATSGEDHGTQVAGIIGAVAYNGKGGRGIAYNSTLRGYNLLASGAYSIANETKALGGDPISSDNDLFNQSFGYSGVSSVWPGSQLQQFSNTLGSINANFTTLRGGLGAVAVHSAGNEFQAWENDKTNRTYCKYAIQYGVSCGDAASDTRRASSIPIVVGALNATGKKSSYSTTGSSLWVSAYGGEYGWDSTLINGNNAYSFAQPYVTMPAITTTALTGCSNYTSVYNSIDNYLSPNPLAANCQYTAIMNGTSSAAPNTSAVVALMLEANPKLSYRDVKYIIASTATKVDANMAPISIGGLVAEQGWVKNAAGFSFNNWYGFGAINAAAAVSMAKSYTQYLPAALSTSAPYNIASDYTLAAGAGVNFPFNANPSNMTVVEGVLVYFNINEPAGYGLYCTQVEVVSPSGTKSILLHAATGFTNLSVVDSRLESNAFYGEPINGAWKVTVWNQCTAAAVLPSPSPITLYLTGH